MKLVAEEIKDNNYPGSGLKLGIIRLGRAAGKTKYCLLDEADIGLVHHYTFEARLEVDRDGMGARVYAYAYIYHKGKESGQYIQDILWERHCGRVEADMRVVHKNCITMDNRLENLQLVPAPLADRWCAHIHHSPIEKSDGKSIELESSLYWVAIQQLPYDPADEFGESTMLRYCNPNGEIVEAEDDSHCYYECRFAPCVAIERDLREFSICGRCQEARYCGASCQQRDWSHHKRVCREKRRPFPLVLHHVLVPDR